MLAQLKRGFYYKGEGEGSTIQGRAEDLIYVGEGEE